MTAERPREPGYFPPTSYEDVTEYEQYPAAPEQALPYGVPYEPEYPHQTLAARPQRTENVPQAMMALLRTCGTFHGRLDRATFWLGALGIVGSFAVAAIVAMVLLIVVGIALGSTAAGVLVALSAAALGIGGLGGMLTLVSAGVRRLHDTGLPGWLVALWFVPFGWIAVVVLLSRPGQPRGNAFGPDPDAV